MSMEYLLLLTDELFRKILKGWKWSDSNDQIMFTTLYLTTFDYYISTVRKCGCGWSTFQNTNHKGLSFTCTTCQEQKENAVFEFSVVAL